jgi:hypothetical protein
MLELYLPHLNKTQIRNELSTQINKPITYSKIIFQPKQAKRNHKFIFY